MDNDLAEAVMKHVEGTPKSSFDLEAEGAVDEHIPALKQMVATPANALRSREVLSELRTILNQNAADDVGRGAAFERACKWACDRYEYFRQHRSSEAIETLPVLSHVLETFVSKLRELGPEFHNLTGTQLVQAKLTLHTEMCAWINETLPQLK